MAFQVQKSKTSLPLILRLNLSPTVITVWGLCEHSNMLAGLGDTTNIMYTITYTVIYVYQIAA